MATRKCKKILSLLLCAVLLFGFVSQGYAVASVSAGLCEHHTEHTEDCGYSESTEGSPCTHEHTEACYVFETNCVHKHNETCYAAEGAEPTECTHFCSEESGCITKKLNCTHEHDEICGYVEAAEGTPCTYNCSECSAQDLNSGNKDAALVANELGAIDVAEENLQELLERNTPVVLGQTYHITSDTTLSGGEIKRGDANTDYLLYVEAGVTLTLTDITIDGQDITANKSLIYIGNGATLIIGNGAVIQNGANNIIVDDIEASKNRIEADGAVTEAQNGTDYAGGVFVDGGNVILNGGKVTGNNGLYGGGIGSYCGNITINTGEISNNFARLAGGGIWLRGTSSDADYKITVNGGQISNNSVGYGENENVQNPKANGAGVYVTYANMTMTGGTISKNKNNNWLGGGIFIGGYEAWTKFEMTGGTISDNFAQVSGGGIYIECGTNATINGSSPGAVQIVGNESKGMTLKKDHYYVSGGGVYVNGGVSGDPDAILTIKNVVVKENISAVDGTDSNKKAMTYGYGSGIGACGTSNVKIYTTDGGAIYKNTTNGEEAYSKIQLYVEKHAANASSYDVNISDKMLGGGSYNWGYFNGTGSQDLSNVNPANNVWASANPSDESIAAAEELATVIISGNKTATIGGGIGTNGTLIIGREAYGDLTISNTVSGSGADKNKDFTFTVTLDDTKISDTYGDMTFKNGVATFTLKHGESKTAKELPAGVTYTVVESDYDSYTVTVNGTDGDTATGTIPAGGESKEAFNNCYPFGDLTVSKSVSGGGASSTKAFTFTVTLNDTTINGKYGDMTFENGVATFTLKHGESKTASGLPTGVTYTVSERDNRGYTVTVTVDGKATSTASGTIASGQTSTVVFNNHKGGGGNGGNGEINIPIGSKPEENPSTGAPVSAVFIGGLAAARF